MKLECDVCHKCYVPDAAQEAFILDAAAKGMQFLMVTCGVCKQSFALDPQSLQAPEADETVPQALCPVQGCGGLVVAVDDFYGCGSCGSVWRDLSFKS